MANRILLADDSITIQKVVNLTFADEGIEVVAVSNGDMAERRLADVRPDLVLADIFMPGKNGYELCEAIKESPQYHHIPVVLLVGAFEPFDQAEARRVKADAHLTKPFESRTLVDTVRKLISASSQPRTGPLPALPVPDAKAAPVEPVPVAPPPAEPRAATQMTQPFNLDLSAMASQSAPPAPPAPPPVLTATAPFNYNYGSSEDPLAVPIEVQVAEAPATETAFAASGNLHRRTDDLSFADSQPPFEALELEDLFAEPTVNEAAPHLATSKPVTSGHGGTGQEPGFGVPSAFGYATEDMLLDFDQPTPAMTRAAHEPFAFDIDEREPASVDATGIQPEETSHELAVEDKVLKTTLLETPVQSMPVDSAINTNPLEMPAAQTAAEAGASAFAANAAMDESSLFNDDAPLGDVLDEGLLEAVVEEAPAAPSAPLENVVESLAVDAPRIEASDPDAAMQVEAATGREAPADYEVEFPASPIAEVAAPAPVAEASAFEMDIPPFEEAAISETGFGFTPIIEEAETVEPLPRASEAKFTTSSMWTNEEARFAAIDIEATPVEEAAEAATSAAPAEPAESFVFDEEASAYITQPNRPVEVAAPVAEEPPASAPPAPAAHAPVAASAVELSPALIDEIVRRVVAQISESVVREIAWEVVPDCVERVIKGMTAQEVSKH
ncbi:MAG: hypothetical protein V7641_787 [Blastocatellia bacterium]